MPWRGQLFPADPWTPMLLPERWGFVCAAHERLWGERPGWGKVEVRLRNGRGVNFWLPKEIEPLQSINLWLLWCQ